MTEEEQEVGQRKFSFWEDKESSFAAGSLSRKFYPTEVIHDNLVALLSCSPSSNKISRVCIWNKNGTGDEPFFGVT